MSDESNREALFTKVGEAIFLSQSLELMLTTLAGVVTRSLEFNDLAGGLIVSEDRKTLGVLIRRLKEIGTVDDCGEEALRVALESRNYVTHEFYNRHVDAHSNEVSFRKATERLDREVKKIAVGTAIVTGWVQAYCSAIGLKLGAVSK